MEHYNMLLGDTVKPGLRIIQTEAYVDMIRNDPGIIHENFGDFYSKVVTENLARTVYDSLNAGLLEANLSGDITFINEPTFMNLKDVDPEKDYLIRERYGIRLHFPLVDADSRVERSTYLLIGALVAEDLFTDEKRGSLQVNLQGGFLRLGNIPPL